MIKPENERIMITINPEEKKKLDYLMNYFGTKQPSKAIDNAIKIAFGILRP